MVVPLDNVGGAAVFFQHAVRTTAILLEEVGTSAC